MTDDSPSCVALIPARAGSKRVPGKNLRPLGGHPLIGRAINSAAESGVFKAVVVSTDSQEITAVAAKYGAEVPFLRPAEFATDISPDIDWVEHALESLRAAGREFDCFSILRPTSPFREPATIRRAWAKFLASPGVDSLRAVQRCSEHPGKMWVVQGDRMLPLLPFGPPGQPWHSSQYPSLPEIYVQNASLEIAWSRVVFDGRTIAGNTIVPFLTTAHEGLDINTEQDWQRAEVVGGREWVSGTSSCPVIRCD